MLNSLRSRSNNAIVKFLLAIVALALIWSLGDFFKKTPDSAVAVIDGDLAISQLELEAAKKNEIAKLGQFLGNLSEEQIQSLNIDSFILQKLINNKLIEKEATKQNLKIADKNIINYIRSEPIFFNELGKFDKERFHRILATNNVREEQYIDLIKKELASKFLISALTHQPIAYNNLAKEINIYNNEERSIDIIKINPSSISNVGNIDDTELEEYYNKNKESFALPEKRSFSYGTLNKDNFSDKINITEEAIRDEYEENKDHYQVNEKRDIYNLLFKNSKEAEDIFLKLQNGKSVKELYKNSNEYLIKNTDKANFPAELQEAGFSLKKGEFSNIINTSIGYHILITDKIIPAHILTYEEAKNEIHSNLKQQKYDEIIFKTIKDIEDEIASGAMFEEVANKFSFKINNMSDLTKDELVSKNEFTKYGEFADAIFSNNIDFISQPISDLTNSNYIIFKIENITPSAVEKFENVRNNISNIVKSSKQDEIAKKMLEEVKSKFSEAKDINKIDLNKNIKIERKNLTRNTNNKVEFTNEFIKNIFTTPLDQLTNIYKTSNGEFIFAAIKHISQNNKEDKQEIKLIEEALAKESLHNISQEYIQYLNQKYSVKIYNTNFQIK